MIEVYHGDLLDLPTEIIQAVDVQITDPPFSEYVHSNAVSTRTGGVGVRERDFEFESISLELMLKISTIASQISRWTIVFSDLESTHLWRESMAAHDVEYIREVPWDSSRAEPVPQRWIRWSQPQVTGDRPPQGCEAVLAFHAMHPRGPRGGAPRPKKKHWNGHGGLMAYYEKAMRGGDKHPTQKPLGLMLSIVAAHSDPGELILDGSAGACTTGLAAKLLGRSCLCIEKQARWTEYGQKRVVSTLEDRDRASAVEWCDRWESEARSIPEPKGTHDIKTWERAQRRLADVERARAWL